MRKLIAGLAIAAGLMLPSTASAATGTIAIQSADSSQVMADVSVTAAEDDLYYGVASWFAYATQVDGAQACSPNSEGDVTMLSTVLSDGTVPRNPDGHFTALGSYSTTVKFTPTHSPQTRLCLYASSLGRSQQIVAEAVVDTPSSGRYRVGAVCKDGWHSSATGSGACSSHGGVSYWLYNEPVTQAPVVAPPLPISTPTPPAAPAVHRSYKLACGSHGGLVLRRKPRACNLSNVRLSKLRWSRWGRTAKATGIARRAKRAKTTVTVSQPKDCGNGNLVYTKIRITTRTKHGSDTQITMADCIGM